MDLSQTPGDRLKRARQQRGLSQGQVCKAIGCGRTTLWRWEEGKTDGIPASKLAQLAVLYGVSLDLIWFGEYRRRAAPPEASGG